MLQLVVFLLLYTLTYNSHSLKTLPHTQLPQGDLLRVGSFNSNTNSDLLFYNSPTNTFKIVNWNKNFLDFKVETISLVTSDNKPISKLTSLITYDFNGNGFTDILLFANSSISLITNQKHSFSTRYLKLEDTPSSKNNKEQLSSLSLVFDIKSSTTVLLGVYYNSDKNSVVIYRLSLDIDKNILSPKDVFIEIPDIDLTKYNNQNKFINGNLVDIIQNDINGDNISDLLFIYNNNIKVAYGSNVDNMKEIKLNRDFDRVLVRNIKRNALPSLIAIKNSTYKTTEELTNSDNVKITNETSYIDIYHLKLNSNADTIFYEMEDVLLKEIEIHGNKDTIDIQGIIDIERVAFSDINIEGNLEIVIPVFPNNSNADKDNKNNKDQISKKEVRFYERNDKGDYVSIETILNTNSVNFLFIDTPILLISNNKKENMFKEITYPENHYYLRLTSLHVSMFNINKLTSLNDKGKKELNNRKKNAVFNTSCPGTSILFDTRDFKNNNYRSSHSITHSSLPYSFELPYLLVGIGLDLNCIEKLMISLPVNINSNDKKKKWFKEELYGLPNSHYLIHMVDPNDPETWEINLDSKPSSALTKVILLVFVIISCMGLIVCYLKYKERKDDFMVDGINNQFF